MPKLDSSDKINGNFKGKDIISIDQFSPKDLEIIFSLTKKMITIAASPKPSKILAGNLVSLIFYEPSSRTCNSFAAAIKRLGGETLENRDAERITSVAKGETLEDTIKVLEAYSDAIIIRHPIAGSAKAASDAAFFVPVINAGDGIGEHPTQAILDFYTIKERFNTLNNLTIVFAGDMLNGRTVHSILRGLALYKNNTAYLLSPKTLKLSREDFSDFSKRGIKLIEIEHESQIPKNAHVWYWTRVQKERFENLKEYESVKHSFILTPKMLASYGNKDLIVMHPLPKVGEIEKEVDDDPRAIYFGSEIRNGMYTRMALLALVLGRV